MPPQIRITPQDYGAVGDGVNNDGPAFLAALDAHEAEMQTAGADGPRPQLYIPSPSVYYNIGSTKLLARGPVNILGAGTYACPIVGALSDDYLLTIGFAAGGSSVGGFGFYNSLGHGIDVLGARSHLFDLRTGKGHDGVGYRIRGLETSMVRLHASTNGASSFGAKSELPTIGALFTAMSASDVQGSAVTLPNDPISTVSNSKLVTVSYTSHPYAVGDLITLGNPGNVTVGGITLINGGRYEVYSTTANSFTVKHITAATATASGGGASMTAQKVYVAQVVCNQSRMADSEFAGVGIGVLVEKNGHGDSNAQYVQFDTVTSQGNGINWLFDSMQSASLTQCHAEAPQIGKITSWPASTAVAKGEVYRNTSGDLYRVVDAGTTGASQPTSQDDDSAITDGTASLRWLGARFDIANTSFDTILLDSSNNHFLGGTLGETSLVGTSKGNSWQGSLLRSVLVGAACRNNHHIGGYLGWTQESVLMVQDFSSGLGFVRHGGMDGNPHADLNGTRLSSAGRGPSSGLVFPFWLLPAGEGWETKASNVALPLGNGSGRAHWALEGTIQSNDWAVTSTERIWPNSIRLTGGESDGGIKLVVPKIEHPISGGVDRVHFPFTVSAWLLTDTPASGVRAENAVIIIRERAGIERRFRLRFPTRKRWVPFHITLAAGNLDLVGSNPLEVIIAPTSTTGDTAAELFIGALQCGFGDQPFGFNFDARAASLNSTLLWGDSILQRGPKADLPPSPDAYPDGTVYFYTDQTSGGGQTHAVKISGSWYEPGNSTPL